MINLGNCVYVWLRDFPIEEGFYWFYGKRIDDSIEPSLYNIELQNIDGELIVLHSDMHMLDKNEFNGEFEGYWTKNISPNLPSDVDNLFLPEEE